MLVVVHATGFQVLKKIARPQASKFWADNFHLSKIHSFTLIFSIVEIWHAHGDEIRFRSDFKLSILGKLKRAVKNKNMEINAAMEFKKTIHNESQGFDLDMCFVGPSTWNSFGP